MNYSIKIDIDAFNDIQNTSEWYEMQSKGLGLRYKNQTKKQINSLKKNPYLFSIKYDEIRCRKIEKFPFLIHYTIDDELKVVNVFAIFHTSRSPEIWKNRNK
ncbi:type II toxin-antitoxin system RelE/ParE family toxin [Flavobacterium geliluteum]|uniref:Type II toxin-antitoxin system RelE/ParE family toxin n=1 Tax=Flavobacterium geliluteum TaxID=2816120 RepID=A0A940X9B7_9FLAO|nr:type II toxin-antitoxin system RelE/ParE family toxin [Flavobacterium geliluteum]MBP4138067.1 type II toxin-antitoxin system RelE/ParE family toxin [Flavobacterium geliluteum]